MLKCHCDENCFFYVKTIADENDKSKYNRISRWRCARYNDNIKKKPCDFVRESFHSSFDIGNMKSMGIGLEESVEIPKSNTVKVKKTNREILNTHLRLYESDCTNYFAKLNRHLFKLGYHPHMPNKESFDELKLRISKKPTKNITIMHNYDEKLHGLEEEELNSTLNDFKWVKTDEYIKKILTIDPKSKHRYPKNKSTTSKPVPKSTTANKSGVNYSKDLINNMLNEETIGTASTIIKMENLKIDSCIQDKDEDDDEDFDNKNLEPETAFDVEEDEDDDDGNDETYEDFSD